MAAPDVCPHCGAEVPVGATACPECGSDESTGWSERARYDSLDLPDENFDYEEFVKREFEGIPSMPRGIRWIWWAVAAALTAGMILAIIR